jgi:hypothetical protein
MRKRYPSFEYDIPRAVFDKFAGKKVHARTVFGKPAYMGPPGVDWIAFLTEDQEGYIWPDTFFRRRK